MTREIQQIMTREIQQRNESGDSTNIEMKVA